MRLSCPYCNHAFDAETAARVTCPRCGDALAVRGDATTVAKSADVEPIPGDYYTRPQPGKSAVPAILAIVMLMVAVALVATFLRVRSNPDRQPAALVAVATPPLKLGGLSYLPANCNLVFAVQPGPLLDYAERTKQDPVELLTKNRVPASVLAALARAGITLQQIDHFVGGLYLPDKDEELRISLVLSLRQPADEEKLLNVLKAKPDLKSGSDRFDVQVDKFNLRMRRVSDTIWAFGLSAKDFGEGTSLAPGLRTAIESQVPHDAAIWVAASGEKWSEKPLVKLLAKDSVKGLAKWNELAVGYSFGEEPRLQLAVRGVDSASVEQLRKQFKGQATGEHSSAGGTNDWATLERAADPAEAFSTVKGFLDDAGR